MHEGVVVSSQPRGELTAEALEAAFTGTIKPVPLQLGYRMGLVLVALATVLLPLVYLGLIAATGYVVYLHATLNTDILTGRGVLWRLLAYLAPIIAGGLLVVFMIKPLFARPAREPDPITLDPARFALLFAFVDHIRRAVRAPSPREIRVDCNVNASASLRRGLLSLGRKDLVLTIGLPLISGMSARQLAGVLAHELGHFAQGSGMALAYLVRSVNAWLWRVVYTRDVWDERLERASEEWDLRVGVVLLLARLFIWLTRKILWVLMMLGHAISTFLLRHMEFDADRY
jgi:Zn-dependent protease with chaperone function